MALDETRRRGRRRRRRRCPLDSSFHFSGPTSHCHLLIVGGFYSENAMRDSWRLLFIVLTFRHNSLCGDSVLKKRGGRRRAIWRRRRRRRRRLIIARTRRTKEAQANPCWVAPRTRRACRIHRAAKHHLYAALGAPTAMKSLSISKSAGGHPLFFPTHSTSWNLMHPRLLGPFSIFGFSAPIREDD